MMRCFLAVTLLAAAAGCGGHKTDTTTTTSTSTATTVAPAATAAAAPASTMSVRTGGAGSGGAADSGQPPGFPDEAAAQGHCVGDQVVWLNTKSHVYHVKGTAYYGHTKQGAYVCRKEADAAGDHAAKNGN